MPDRRMLPAIYTQTHAHTHSGQFCHVIQTAIFLWPWRNGMSLGNIAGISHVEKTRMLYERNHPIYPLRLRYAGSAMALTGGERYLSSLAMCKLRRVICFFSLTPTTHPSLAPACPREETKEMAEPYRTRHNKCHAFNATPNTNPMHGPKVYLIDPANKLKRVATFIIYL